MATQPVDLLWPTLLLAGVEPARTGIGFGQPGELVFVNFGDRPNDCRWAGTPWILRDHLASLGRINFLDELAGAGRSGVSVGAQPS